jgi:mycothiol synthase
VYPGVTTRPPSTEDAAEIAALRRAANMAEIGSPYTDETEVRAQLNDPGLNIAEDWILVLAPDGHLIGSGTVWPEAPYTETFFDHLVHPGSAGQGIGTFLVDWAEARARQIATRTPTGDRVVVRHAVWVGAPAAEQFFETRGYRVVRYFQVIELAMDQAPASPVWPEGITVRAMVPGQDDRALYQADVEGMGERFGHSIRTFESWRHALTTIEGFDPDLVFLALDSGEIAGYAIFVAGTSGSPDSGWLEGLAVRPRWRRRGIVIFEKVLTVAGDRVRHE